MAVDAATTRLKLRVSPGARRPGVAGRYGDAWKVRVVEPPEDGRANDAVLRLLSDALGVRAELVSGFASRDKVVALPVAIDIRFSGAHAAVGRDRAIEPGAVHGQRRHQDFGVIGVC